MVNSTNGHLTWNYVNVPLSYMERMRLILKALMDSQGHTGHSLYELSGVPSATTYRFLSGSHGEPRSSTIRRWARVYGVTEAQLRGSEPIDGVAVQNPGEEDIPLASVLTRDELEAIEGMRRLDKETRRSWLKLTKQLCRDTEDKNIVVAASNRSISGSRRTRSLGMTQRNQENPNKGGLAKKA